MHRWTEPRSGASGTTTGRREARRAELLALAASVVGRRLGARQRRQARRRLLVAAVGVRRVLLVPQSGQKANEAGECSEPWRTSSPAGAAGRSGRSATTPAPRRCTRAVPLVGARRRRLRPRRRHLLVLVPCVPQKGPEFADRARSSNSSDCQSSPAAFARLPHTQSAPPRLSTATGSRGAAAVEKEEGRAASAGARRRRGRGSGPRRGLRRRFDELARLVACRCGSQSRLPPAPPGGPTLAARCG